MIAEVKTISDIKQVSDEIEKEVSRYVVGWEGVTRSLIIALLTGGHVLIEGVPGTAKTYLAKIFSDSLSLEFKRIQSTPDLMPADITGSRIFNPKTLEFDFMPGPIFANIVLVDEINRAPPKTQSALLEAMQESQCTVDGNTMNLEEPFMILATKNPIEFAGTYPLPPAQLDRFMSRLIMNYPVKEAWVEVLRRKNVRGETIAVESVVQKEAVLSARRIIRHEVEVEDDVLDYVADIVRSTRTLKNVILGGSPTASISLLKASKGHAAVAGGRNTVTKDDVRAVAFDVLNHRLLLREGTLDATKEEDSSDYGMSQIRNTLAQSMATVKS